MTDIASALKAEISRIARKELRKETTPLRKAISGYRSEIAELKRRAQTLEQALKRVGKERARPTPVVAEETANTNHRFSAKGFATLRQRLALSAEQLGLLLGASSQSVYNWESGKARPRATHLPAIASLRTLGKREAAAKLAALHEKV
jgi:DNA-binding transcriptional regulator YiaG